MRKYQHLSVIFLVGIVCAISIFQNSGNVMEPTCELPNSAGVTELMREGIYFPDFYTVEFDGIPQLMKYYTNQIPGWYLVQPVETFEEEHGFLRVDCRIDWYHLWPNPIKFGDTLSIRAKGYYGGMFNTKANSFDSQLNVTFDYKAWEILPNDPKNTITFSIWVDLGEGVERPTVLEVQMDLYLNYYNTDLEEDVLVKSSSREMSYDYSSGLSRFTNGDVGDYIGVALIIIIILVLNFILISFVGHHQRESRRQSTELAKSLIKSGIFAQYESYAVNVAEEMQIEDIQEEEEEKESDRKKKHLDDKFETQIIPDSKKRYYYIPGYYDTTVTFPKFILLTAVLLMCIMIAGVSLWNYVVKFNSIGIPFLVYAYLVILAIVFGIGISMNLAYSAIRLQKLRFRDIEAAGYTLPKFLENGDEEKAETYSSQLVSEIDNKRGKASKIVGLIASGPLFFINLVIILVSIVFIGLLFVAAFIAVFAAETFLTTIWAQMFNLETIQLSMNIFEFTTSLTLENILFFGMNIVFVILLIRSIFIRQYNFIANIANGIMFLFLYSQVIPVLPWLLLGFGIFQAVFALIIVPKQQSESHHYNDLKKPEYHYRNGRLYLAERLQSQRWYIYIPIAWLAISSSLITGFDTIVLVNLISFGLALILDWTIHSSRRTLKLHANKKLMYLFIGLGLASLITFIMNLFGNLMIVADFGIGFIISLKIFLTVSGNISNIQSLEGKTPRKHSTLIALGKAKDKIGETSQKLYQAAKKRVRRADELPELKASQEMDSKVKSDEKIVYFVTPEAVKLSVNKIQEAFKGYADMKLPEIGKSILDKFIKKIQIPEGKLPNLIKDVVNKVGNTEVFKDKLGKNWAKHVAKDVIVPGLVDVNAIEAKKV